MILPKPVYDRDRKVITYTSLNGTQITRTYDSKKRLREETVNGDVMRRWTYDDRLRSTFDTNDPNTDADDVTCTYFYDSKGRPTEEKQRIGPSGTELLKQAGVTNGTKTTNNLSQWS